ncbi:MAG: right-handed parallel beta-helix repeat-containing protein, partial [Caldilineaceae bacterium]|nr:right-handed parallel beta-helix repeat-containing protein [Caldilineaceae bacterium]
MTPPMQPGGVQQHKRAVIAAALLSALFIIVLLSSLSPLIYAQDLPPIRYSSTSNILTIGRPYLPLIQGEAPFVTNPSHPDAPKLAITLPQLYEWTTANGQSDLLRNTGNGLWEIAVNIDVEDTAQLDLTAASGVKAVRLISRPEASYNLIADGGTLNIDGIKLYSWDNTPGVDSYDETFLTKEGVMQTRSFLAALYGGRMEIKNAEIMYLGHEELNDRVGYGKGEPSGLAWRLRPPGTNNPTSGPKGSIINSKVHHNYFGMYSYEAAGLEIRNSEFYGHYYYGLDPHDYSFGFVVADNVIHNNGYTGLIFSRHCTDNEIYGNQIYNNDAHGFMLDRGSNNNRVYNNTIYNNQEDGVAIYQSSNNHIYDNHIDNNGRYGVRLS